MRVKLLPSGWWARPLFDEKEIDSDSFEAVTGHWALAGSDLHDNDRLWRQYLVLVDLYKYYLEIAWKVSVWYYATTGAVLSFMFDRLEGPNAHPLLLVLVFVSLMSCGLSLLSYRAARYLLEMAPWLEHCVRALRLPGRPHVEFASLFLFLNAVMYAIVSVAALSYFAARWW